ncbi:MAG TPA: CheR family methyltransferase [Rhodocyclaceae bacterium]|nr:CheR family methyltransferase [Rhodocyclaceae bacterium]
MADIRNSQFLPEREFEFRIDDFERVRKLIYRYAGISLAPIKKNMAYSRLVRRVRARNCLSFSEYLTLIEHGDQAEMEIFVNSLTTNLTSFFRETHHFEILGRHLQKVAAQGGLTRIWCSAASTGEESYSLAITACETFDTLSPPVSIIASDIDTNVLTMARNGIYPKGRIAKLTPEQQHRFFIEDADTQPGFVRVRPELQKLIKFTRVNLLGEHWPSISGSFDAIFCRNVMIYFDKATQYQILKKFAALLREDGLLFAGHSESFLHATDLFHSLGQTVYERAGRAYRMGPDRPPDR